jgi:hypothetical protein
MIVVVTMRIIAAVVVIMTLFFFLFLLLLKRNSFLLVWKVTNKIFRSLSFMVMTMGIEARRWAAGLYN